MGPDYFWRMDSCIWSKEKRKWFTHLVHTQHGHGRVLLTELWGARVEFLRQKAVISEALNGVSHRDDGHHHQPAPQDVQEAAHFLLSVKVLSGSEKITCVGVKNKPDMEAQVIEQIAR